MVEHFRAEMVHSASVTVEEGCLWVNFFSAFPQSADNNLISSDDNLHSNNENQKKKKEKKKKAKEFPINKP